MSLRSVVERHSAGPLRALHRQPRALLPVASAALLAGVVFLPEAPATLCLLALLALVGWLSYLSWPAVDGRGRVIRVATVLVLLALGVQSISG